MIDDQMRDLAEAFAKLGITAEKAVPRIAVFVALCAIAEIEQGSAPARVGEYERWQRILADAKRKIADND